MHGVLTISFIITSVSRKYGKEVDVYSFAITMWVVATGTGDEPYLELRDFWDVIEYVTAGEIS